MAQDEDDAPPAGARSPRRSHWRVAVGAGALVIAAAVAAPVAFGSDGPARRARAPMMGTGPMMEPGQMMPGGHMMEPGQMMPGMMPGSGPMMAPGTMAERMPGHMPDMGPMMGRAR